VAAAERPQTVGAVVRRGGQPDLAGSALPRVEAPTLQIVGGNDAPVIEMNRRALEKLRREKRLELVAGSSHLFEEPGTLDRVARRREMVPRSSRVGRGGYMSQSAARGKHQAGHASDAWRPAGVAPKSSAKVAD
jgi:dienelactone hydrolase